MLSSYAGCNAGRLPVVYEGLRIQSAVFHTGTKSVDATYHEMLRVIKLLEFPEEWIPPTRAKYVESVRAGGKPIVDKLKNYAAQIAKLR